VEQEVWPGCTDIVYNAHCVPGRLSPPRFAVERGRGRGIEGLPLLVREACLDGLAVYPVAEAVVPLRGPCFPGEAGGVEVGGGGLT
jgi:hypothetical protein